MNARGDCFDNAVAERFFRSLKSERLRYRSFQNHAEARAEVTDYIEMFYNPIRLHSYPDYQSPDEFEKLSELEKVA